VNGGVGGVLELAHEVERRVGLRELLGLGDRALHALRARREHELGAERDEHLPPLEAHRVGHGQHAAVPTRGRGEREGDAGVAARGLHDAAARPQEALLLGVPHHRRADAALHRVRGVPPLDLREHARASALREAPQLDERCAANASGVVLVNARHRALLLSFVILELSIL
jgi:hypothetical protein